MPISSIFSDVEVPPLDLWTFYMDRKIEYPSDHRMSSPIMHVSSLTH